MERLAERWITCALVAAAACTGCGGDDDRGSDGGRARDGGPRDGGAAVDAASPDDAGASADASSAGDAGPDGGTGAGVFPGATWATRAPSEVGLDPGVVDDFVGRVGGDGCLVKDGYMVRTWGDPSAKADWASASKPVTVTMLFFAIEEGRLDGVDHLVADLGWALTDADASMTFRDLANMTSGYARAEGPGEAWAYNDYAIELYKKSLFDRVFDDGSADAAARDPSRLGALGFEDGSIYGSRGGYGLSTSCRDFARIGWLWLNRGAWDGEQLLPRHYFDDYMRPGVAGDLPRTTGEGSDYLGVGSFGGGSDQTEYGPGIYGFNWWFNAPVGTGSELTWPDAPTDTFQANGHWNREVVTVIPSLGLVVAARGDWGAFEPGNADASMNRNLALLASAVTP